jgi:hypothetical protein
MGEAQVGNMVFQAVGRTLLVVHNKDYPTDAEWDAYLEALIAQVSSQPHRRSLVFTEGGAPSSKQRARMTARVGDAVAPTAVVSSSPAVRATVGALNLHNKAIGVFAPSDIDGALGHLGLKEDERGRILACLPSLQQRVGNEPHCD